MPGENPGAYDEARKRIRETKESEIVVIEKKKEDFEKSKEKLHSKKKLDVYELRRRIETGQSLNTLKSDIQAALESGQISIDTYTDVLESLTDAPHQKPEKFAPEYTMPVGALPGDHLPLTAYFLSQKLGKNPLIDMAGFVYGMGQGSIFLLFLMGRMVLDALLLPHDIYTLIKHR